MFKLSLLLLVGSAAAFFTSGENSNLCYDVVENGSNEWFAGITDLTMTITSDINTVVFTKVDPLATELKIETQFFPKAGMTADFTVGREALTIDVGEKAAPVEDDTTSGSTSIQGSAVAYVAATLVAVISVWGSPSKTSLTVLLVIGLAMSAATVESAGEAPDCATFGKESRAIIVITFPKAGSEYAQDKVTIDSTGMKKDSMIEEDSGECGACMNDTPECQFNLDGKVTCIPASGKAVANLVSFSWLDEDCKDTGNAAAPTSVAGVVIFSHGWQKGGGLKKSSPCWFGGKKGGINPSTDEGEIKPFIAKGWKVGHVHWERFADEGEVKDAEAKIWTNGGKRNMRYKTDANRYADSGNEAVADQLWPMVRSAIKNAANAGKRIIMGGHSLGSQVITNIAYRYIRDPAITTTKTFDLWLLDAFFSKGGKDYFGGTTNGDMMYAYVDWLQNTGEVRVHRTKTSSLSGGISGEAMKAIDNQVMFSEHVPSFFGFFGFADKHNSAFIYWLRSVKGWGGQTGKDAPPPILSEDDFSGCSWKQSAGQKTVITGDDRFKKSGSC